MTTTEIRIKGYERVIKWLMSNLSMFDYRPVSRQLMSKQADIPDWMVSRSLLVLTNKAYLIKQQTGKVAHYKLCEDTPEVTPEEINTWIIEYNEEANDRCKAKKSSLTDVSGEELTINDTLTIPTDFCVNPRQYVAFYNFGFYGPNGAEWFLSKDEAVRKAKEIVSASGVPKIEIIQRLATVINEPSVMYFD